MMAKKVPEIRDEVHDPVGVVARNSTDYLQTMLANLAEGRTSVPLRNADDRERIDRAGVSEILTPAKQSGWIRQSFTSRGGEEPAMISFTSGTEGDAKAVLLSFDALHDVVVRVTAAMEIDSEIREYIGIPVFHSFGYGRARIALNAGGEAYIPPNGFNLMEIRRMLEVGEINAISAVPTLWRVFLRETEMFGPLLKDIRWVEIGSQFMSKEEKQALRACLPNAKIVQHYGLTEASRTTLQRIHKESVELLGSVGSAEGDVEIRIDGRGRIETRGPHVALGIDDGKRYRAVGKGQWFKTSDLGRIENGRLWFDGRADDIINCGGVKISPELVEADLQVNHQGLGGIAVLRRPDPIRGEGVLLALTPEAVPRKRAIVDAVAEYLERQGLAARGAIETFEVESLPRTSTGKLQRKALALQWNRSTKTERRIEEKAFADEIQGILGFAPDPDASFLDLAGDSLTHMELSLAIERALGELPANWESIPLAELTSRPEAMAEVEVHEERPSGAPALPKGDRNLNPEGMPFWSLIAEDFRTNDASIFHQGFLMLFVHRFGNWRMSVRPKILRAPLTIIYRVLNKSTQILFGMKLDYTVKVGRRVKLEHFGGMILGAREIGDDVILRQNTTLGIRSTDDLKAKPVIGNRVDIGAGAVVVGNITVGDNSVVGANSVVFTNVPPNSVVLGVPAKIVGRNRRINPSPLKGYPRDGN